MTDDTPLTCERCNAKLALFATADGFALVEREPHALGDYALIGRLAVRIVPGWQQTALDDGRITEQDARGKTIRYLSHRCGQSIPPPEDLVKTRPERPRNIRRGGR